MATAQVNVEFDRILRGGVFHPIPVRPAPARRSARPTPSPPSALASTIGSTARSTLQSANQSTIRSTDESKIRPTIRSTDQLSTQSTDQSNIKSKKQSKIQSKIQAAVRSTIHPAVHSTVRSRPHNSGSSSSDADFATIASFACNCAFSKRRGVSQSGTVSATTTMPPVPTASDHEGFHIRGAGGGGGWEREAGIYVEGAKQRKERTGGAGRCGGGTSARR